MRLAAALVLVLILAVAAGAAVPPTRITVFRPFVRGKLAPRLHITRTVKGECFSGSNADPRSDAWRCSVGNSSVDPCFSDPKVPSWVACPESGSPFGTGVIRLALARALPKTLGNDGSAGEGNPWAIKLADGKVCTFLTGPTFAYHGQRVNYGCTVKAFLAGSPNRATPTWTIMLGMGRKSKPQTAEILVAAW